MDTDQYSMNRNQQTEIRRTRVFWRKRFIIPLVVLLTGGWLLFMDDALRDDSDLVVLPASLPEEINPLPRLERELLKTTRMKVPRQWISDSPLPLADVAGFLDANRPQMDLIFTALGDQSSKGNWRHNRQSLDIDQMGNNAQQIGWMQCLRLQARYDLQNGEVAKALACGETMLRLGDELAVASEGLLDLLIHGTNQAIAIGLLKEVLTHEEMTGGDIRSVIALLADAPKHDMPGILRQEYTMSIPIMDKLRKNEPVSNGFPVMPTNSVTLKPNRTLNVIMDFYRNVIGAWNGDYVGWTNYVKEQEAIFSNRPITLGLINKHGETMISELKLSPFVSSVQSSLNERAGMMLVLALRLHQIEEGEIPVSLEDLVPRFLSKMPLDSFTNKPFFYDAATGLVYSAGVDGNDDGGQYDVMAKPGEKKHDDVPWGWDKRARDPGFVYPWPR